MKFLCISILLIILNIFIFKSIEREFCPYLTKKEGKYILIKNQNYFEENPIEFDNKKEAFKALLKEKKEFWKRAFKKIKEGFKSLFPLLS